MKKKSIFTPCFSVSPRKLTKYLRVSKPDDGIKELTDKVKIEKEKLTEVGDYLVNSDGEIVTDDKAIKEHNRLKNLKDNRTNGKISKSARRNLLDCVSWFSAISVNQGRKGNIKGFRLGLLTLTLPSSQVHTDIVIKEALNRFFEYMRDNYKLKNYMWRAERQKNGNIHFHIVWNIYVDKIDVSRYWNAALEPLGYIDAYEKKHGKRNPPSTKIEAVHKAKNLALYLAKYLCKETAPDLKPIEGRQWFLSQALSKLKTKVFLHSDALDRELEQFTLHCWNTEKVGYGYTRYAWHTYDYAKCMYVNIFNPPGNIRLSDYPILWRFVSDIFKEYSPLVNN